MILCADDFGLAADINEAITSLVHARRLSAVSCMVTAPFCPPAALAGILGCRQHTDIGLHLAFTEVPFALPHDRIPSLVRPSASYGSLMRRALIGGVRAAEAEAEIRAQYDRFIRLTGAAPAFIDGHDHAHQLPGVRDGLIAFLKTLLAGVRPYVRNTYIPLWRNLRTGVSVLKNIALSMPGKRLRRALLRHGIPTNDGFTGIYDFRKTARYPQFFRRFLAALPSPSGILMVHPGLHEPWRRMEYETLRTAPDLDMLCNPMASRAA